MTSYKNTHDIHVHTSPFRLNMQSLNVQEGLLLIIAVQFHVTLTVKSGRSNQFLEQIQTKGDCFLSLTRCYENSCRHFDIKQ